MRREHHIVNYSNTGNTRYRSDQKEGARRGKTAAASFAYIGDDRFNRGAHTLCPETRRQ